MDAIALTRGPAAHFFGYFNICPWNATGTTMVVHRTTCTSELPRANDVAELLALEGEDFRTAERIGETTAWNWQQGSLLQWVGQNPTTVVFNRRDGEHRFHARRLDIVSGNPAHNLASESRFAVLLGHLRAGRVNAWIIGPPCETWSRARFRELLGLLRRAPRP